MLQNVTNCPLCFQKLPLFSTEATATSSCYTDIFSALTHQEATGTLLTLSPHKLPSESLQAEYEHFWSAPCKYNYHPCNYIQLQNTLPVTFHHSYTAFSLLPVTPSPCTPVTVPDRPRAIVPAYWNSCTSVTWPPRRSFLQPQELTTCLVRMS